MAEITVFEILGIENKELPVSNLLTYYFDPKSGLENGRGFINDFLQEISKIKKIGIAPISETAEIHVKREYHIENKGKNNSIDILLKIGADEEKPDRIICIENKINSEEGVDQTQRYYEALEEEFSECADRQYIYLTKNNSFVNLSSQHFIHVRYNLLGELLNREPYANYPFAKDFLDFYIERDEKRFTSIDQNDKELRKDNTQDYEELIEYIVWKLNNVTGKENHSTLWCMQGKSPQSPEHFFQISKQNWNFDLNGKQMNIHFESSSRSITHLHMERSPYVPFSRIVGESEDYSNTRNQIRDTFKSVYMNDSKNEYFEAKDIRWNADLCVADFEIKGNTFKEFISSLYELIEHVNKTLISTDIISEN